MVSSPQTTSFKTKIEIHKVSRFHHFRPRHHLDGDHIKIQAAVKLHSASSKVEDLMFGYAQSTLVVAGGHRVNESSDKAMDEPIGYASAEAHESFGVLAA